MKERPILFSAPMVRALLDGSKTQTRRVVKPQPDFLGAHGDPSSTQPWITREPGLHVFIVCPYGAGGDRLWVRETWYCDDYRVQQGPYLLPAGRNADEMREDGTIVYCADDAAPYEQEQPVWRPSIHMPRWASRITLEVTDVRVERLKDISEADALAEGIVHEVRDPGLGRGGRPGYRWAANQYAGTAVHGYELLWESINGPGSWAANPWVWVVEFNIAKETK